jgi:hypothetical protein
MVNVVDIMKARPCDESILIKLNNMINVMPTNNPNALYILFLITSASVRHIAKRPVLAPISNRMYTETMIKAIIPVFLSVLYFLSANSTSMIDAEHDRMKELPALVSKGPVIGNP